MYPVSFLKWTKVLFDLGLNPVRREAVYCLDEVLELLHTRSYCIKPSFLANYETPQIRRMPYEVEALAVLVQVCLKRFIPAYLINF